MCRPAHSDLAGLGGHHEWGQPVVVEHRLQVAVGEEARALEQQQVIHLGDELGVLARVVGDGHQRMQHRVATGVLAPHVSLLVRVLRQVVDDLWLVGAGGQRQRQLPCGDGTGHSVRAARSSQGCESCVLEEAAGPLRDCALNPKSMEVSYLKQG